MMNSTSRLLDKVARGIGLPLYRRGGIYPAGAVRGDEDIMDGHIPYGPDDESSIELIQGPNAEETMKGLAKGPAHHQEQSVGDDTADHVAMEKEGAAGTEEIEHWVQDENKNNQAFLARQSVNIEDSGLDGKVPGPGAQALPDMVVEDKNVVIPLRDSRADIETGFEKRAFERFDVRESRQTKREAEPGGLRTLFTEQIQVDGMAKVNEASPGFSENIAHDRKRNPSDGDESVFKVLGRGVKTEPYEIHKGMDRGEKTGVTITAAEKMRMGVRSGKEALGTLEKNREASAENDPAKEAYAFKDGDGIKRVEVRNKTFQTFGNIFPAPEAAAPQIKGSVPQKGSMKVGKINIIIKGAQKKDEEHWPHPPSYSNHMITEDWEWSCLYGKQGS